MSRVFTSSVCKKLIPWEPYMARLAASSVLGVEPQPLIVTPAKRLDHTRPFVIGAGRSFRRVICFLPAVLLVLALISFFRTDHFDLRVGHTGLSMQAHLGMVHLKLTCRMPDRAAAPIALAHWSEDVRSAKWRADNLSPLWATHFDRYENGNDCALAGVRFVHFNAGGPTIDE